MDKINFNKLHSIYTSFAKQKDYNHLLETILIEVMNVTNCDAGTLYTCENSHLHFKIVKTLSMSINQNDVLGTITPEKFPPVPMDPKNICARSALSKELINIEDVYHSEYNFEGPKKYDKLTGYRTQSMLIVPMENDFGEIIGVFQLINAMKDGQVIPFDSDYHEYVLSIAAQAAICLTNMKHKEENTALLQSLVEVLTTAIDERSVFNANHTRNMTKYGESFLNWLDETEQTLRFSDTDKRQMIMSIQLHDIGKLTTPGYILNKESRLGDNLVTILNFIQVLKLSTKVSYYENLISKEEMDNDLLELQLAKELIENANKAGYLTPDVIEKLELMNKKTYLTPNGDKKHILSESELNMITVVKGSLTDEERIIMQNHVVLTAKMLDKVKFTKDFKQVANWASSHHEYINGSGYPNKLSGEDVSIPIRLLTILDIFEALISTDRPYKSPMEPSQAFKILELMVDEGKLDGDILALFKESKVWEIEACI